MRKKVGIIKRAISLLLVFLISINSFAAVVSDNDGSAFITKAEFDSLKNSFQSQIDSYNKSIDNKIDGAIASYLAGIRVSQPEVESDSWIYSLNWYNALPKLTYNSSYCSDSANPHKEYNKSAEAMGAYSNMGFFDALVDDNSAASARIIVVGYNRPGTGGYGTYTIHPDEEWDDTTTSKNNAKYTWSDGGGGKKVFETLAWYSYYTWRVPGGSHHAIVQNYHMNGQVNWNDTANPAPTFYLKFDDKGYPSWHFEPVLFRGNPRTGINITPGLDLSWSHYDFGTFNTFMLGKPDTSSHITDPYNAKDWIDGAMEATPIKFRCQHPTSGAEVVFDDTHGVKLQLNEWAGAYYQIDNTDTTTTKFPQQNRMYKKYEWDSSVDKDNVIFKVIRGVSQTPCDWYNKYSLDYEPIKLYEGAPVMQALPATGMYKVTIKTNGSAQVNLMKDKFGRTTTGNGNTLIRYNENGTENGYAQNMACNTTLTFWIKGEKGKKYYCRINPTSTTTNTSVRITSFKYQQVG